MSELDFITASVQVSISIRSSTLEAFYRPDFDFLVFLKARFFKDYDDQKGSSPDASLIYESHLQEYQALLEFTSERFFN